MFRVLWRPSVEGREQIPATGPLIIASNHLSFIDSIVIPLAVPRKVVFLAKAEYWEGRSPAGLAAPAVLRRVRGRARCSGSSSATPRRRWTWRRQVLARGDAFGIYPEGTRSRDGRLYRGRTGVGWLALASGAPVVPVGWSGTDRVQPIGATVPRVRRGVTIRFGEPVDSGRLRAPAARPGPAGDHRRR